jgi:hypothetical protein
MSDLRSDVQTGRRQEQTGLIREEASAVMAGSPETSRSTVEKLTPGAMRELLSASIRAYIDQPKMPNRYLPPKSKRCFRAISRSANVNRTLDKRARNHPPKTASLLHQTLE